MTAAVHIMLIVNGHIAYLNVKTTQFSIQIDIPKKQDILDGKTRSCFVKDSDKGY